jgi:hypothetical protein
VNFAALNSLTQRTAARYFSRSDAGESLCAWFPEDADAKPSTIEGYTVAAGEVADGPVKMRTAEALGLHLSPETLRSISLAPLCYTPRKSVTTFLVGYPAAGTTAPDPERVSRYRIAELRMGAGFWEIDAEKIAPVPSV